mgnify:CR=1 FL=1
MKTLREVPIERTPLLKVTLPNLADMDMIERVYNENK